MFELCKYATSATSPTICSSGTNTDFISVLRSEFTALGSGNGARYWSSSNKHLGVAWNQNWRYFSTYSPYYSGAQSEKLGIRAIRAFGPTVTP